jgi:Lysyl oxidase
VRERLILVTVVVGGVVLAVGATLAFAGKPGGGTTSTANYPDLRAVVPAHVQLVNQQQRETLRFSNGIANTGGGPWALRPEPELGTAEVTIAMQEIRSSNAQYECGSQPKPSDPCYTVLQEFATTEFEYHEEHHHWHTADVARFEVRKGDPVTGPLVGGNSIKVGFCLIDLYKLDDNAPTSEKTFWDCYTSFQGVSVGWVDQYHQATDGQQLDLTGVPNATDYYLVTTTNPTGIFHEQSYANNTEWVKFTLSGSAGGNRKVTVTDHSPCENPGMCGERSANR